MSKYSIQYEDLGIMYQDSGPWRSYELNASGDTLQELLEDVTISEVDQDGGELGCYSLDEADNEVTKAVYRELEAELHKVDRKELTPKEQEYVNLRWQLLEHKLMYYMPEKVHFSRHKQLTIEDTAYDALELEMIKLGTELHLPTNKIIDFPVHTESGQLVIRKLARKKG